METHNPHAQPEPAPGSSLSRIREEMLGAMRRLLCRLTFTPIHRSVIIAAAVAVTFVVAGLVHTFHSAYDGAIEAMVNSRVFHPAAGVYAETEFVRVGDRFDQSGLIEFLRGHGYEANRSGTEGYFQVKGENVEIHPGRLAPGEREAAVVQLRSGRVARITSIDKSTPLRRLAVNPELITNLHDHSRAKRRLVRYSELPLNLRQAILAIEDHRFFEHDGIDLKRTLRAATDGIRKWRKPRGTSTITQQLARNFFLNPERSYSRKIRELLIARKLEERLTKEQIFEYYCNHVWMGREDSFDIRGMGEAASAYFGKDISDVSDAEAALLGGLIQRPSYLNPYRHPERAERRRNMVLRAMLEHGYIDEARYGAAVATPVKLERRDDDGALAPYFVDLTNRRLRDQFSERELAVNGYHVYTTLDTRLQREAEEAVRTGAAELERALRRQRRFRGRTPPRPEVALIALDPATGAVKALVGGRDYRQSQLNRALAKRQPGSVFKPFVYAAALSNRPEDQSGELLTAASVLNDEPTEFQWNGDTYEPANFHDRFGGEVTVREALRSSLNVATVNLARRIGYDEVASLARSAQLSDAIEASPSLALGAYEVTPLDLAAAYTIFANGGVRVEPFLIREVRNSEGQPLFQKHIQAERVLDERVAFIITSLLEDVVNRGTGRRVRSLGFTEPAAGKTGTDDDGWFAGYTKNLLCVVWVGIDDNRDLRIEGARSALPIWTEFMKRALRLPEYRMPGEFERPEGVVSLTIDSSTSLVATRRCPSPQEEFFIRGTEPAQKCKLHQPGFFSRLFRIGRYRPLDSYGSAAGLPMTTSK